MKVYILSVAMASLLINTCSDDIKATDTPTIQPKVQDGGTLDG